MPDKTHTPFAANLRAIIDATAKGSVNAWCLRYKDFGITQSRINRCLNGTQDPGLATLEQVSQATGYAPWQLLHPDFEPGRMPPMMDAEAMRVAAVFAGIKNPDDRRRARAIIEQFEIEPEPLPAEPSGRQTARL